MAASTAFTAVPPCSSWACQARHVQESSHLRAHTSFASKRKGLLGQSLPQQKTTTSNAFKAPSSSVLSIAASSEFAQKEAAKFHDDLAEELGKYENLADVRGRIAETCAKALQNYVATYSGGLEAKPIEDMKAALKEQGLPHEKALCCAVWWVRAYLRRDWEQYSTVRR